MESELDEETLQELYAWIDKIPLSRPKRNITRDFSDGVMAAEVVKHFFPKLVELHNYTPANSTQQKLANWSTLNRKVLCKLNFHVPDDVVKKIVMNAAGVIEAVLVTLRDKIESKRISKASNNIQHMEYYSVSYDSKEPKESGDKGLEPVPVKATESKGVARTTKDRPEVGVLLGADVDPSIRLLLEEKEQSLLAMKETVEILQIKVSRLEHLLQLKDLRIEDLSRHLQRYKNRTSS
ncbi:sperm flagellar protein 1 [Engraulis encrasicolus]|uniref:sperm flagellar protein 1 n=1 Tax=Engraulis encrasicolus TaxID=184585 RepID=UPI002FD4B3BD